MTESPEASTTGQRGTYQLREVVGVFPSPEAVEAGFEALEEVGFDRAAISVLAPDEAIRQRIGHLYTSAAEAADDPNAPRGTFVSRHSRAEAEAAAIGVPFQIGGYLGAFAVVSAGGALAAAIAATLLGGVIGGGIGALLARAVAGRFAAQMREDVARGGLLLWVTTPDDAAEQRAMTVLRRFGATSVHAHTLMREWDIRDRPLHDRQMDPFLLERDPEDE